MATSRARTKTAKNGQLPKQAQLAIVHATELLELAESDPEPTPPARRRRTVERGEIELEPPRRTRTTARDQADVRSTIGVEVREAVEPLIRELKAAYVELGQERVLREKEVSMLRVQLEAAQSQLASAESQLRDFQETSQSYLNAGQRIANLEVTLARYRSAYGDLHRRRRSPKAPWWKRAFAR
jgi:vacuolar-type H+-ATPase subunit I/STV1